MKTRSPAVLRFIDEAGRRLAGSKSYLWPNIPEKKLANALGSIAKDIDAEDVLILIDATIFGSAKDGVIITESVIYFKEAFTNPIKVPLDSIAAIGFEKDHVYLNDAKIFATAGIDAGEASAFVALIREEIDRRSSFSVRRLDTPHGDRPGVVPTPKEKTVRSVAGNPPSQGVGDSIVVRGTSGNISPPDHNRRCMAELRMQLDIPDIASVSGVFMISMLSVVDDSGSRNIKNCVKQAKLYPNHQVPRHFEIIESMSIGGVEDPEAVRAAVRLIPMKCDWMITDMQIVIGKTSNPGMDREDHLGRVALRDIFLDATDIDGDTVSVVVTGLVENQTSSSLPLVVHLAELSGSDGTVVTSTSHVDHGVMAFQYDLIKLAGTVDLAEFRQGGKLSIATGIPTRVFEPTDLDVPLALTEAQNGSDEADEDDGADDDAGDKAVDAASTFVIEFRLSQGDGEIPTHDELSKDEAADLRRCSLLSLDWDTEQFDEEIDVEVVGVEVLYDGVTLVPELDLFLGEGEVHCPPS